MREESSAPRNSRHIYKLPATLRETVGQQDLHVCWQLLNIARQRVAHLNRTRQFRTLAFQHLCEILAGMPASSEVKRDLPA